MSGITTTPAPLGRSGRPANAMKRFPSSASSTSRRWETAAPHIGGAWGGAPRGGHPRPAPPPPASPRSSRGPPPAAGRLRRVAHPARRDPGQMARQELAAAPQEVPDDGQVLVRVPGERGGRLLGDRAPDRPCPPPRLVRQLDEHPPPV